MIMTKIETPDSVVQIHIKHGSKIKKIPLSIKVRLWDISDEIEKLVKKEKSSKAIK